MSSYKNYTGIIQDAGVCPDLGVIPFIYLDLWIVERQEHKTFQIDPQLFMNQLGQNMPENLEIMQQVEYVKKMLNNLLGKKITIQDFSGPMIEGIDSFQREGYIPPEDFDADDFQYT